MLRSIFSLAMITPFVAMAWSFSPDEIESDLKSFRRDARSFLNTLPSKKVQLPQWFLRDHQDFYHYRNNYRGWMFHKNNPNKAMIQENDKVEMFLETSDILRNIFHMHQNRLLQGKVKRQPWSDDYWPIKKGILANRYADSEFQGLNGWDLAHRYYQANSPLASFQSLDLDKINLLSPAEKYDLLIGERFNLTKYSWRNGQSYFEEYGEVESWMGICHGWAPASYMLKRPSRKIEVMSSDNKTPITFYPSDIKALASMLWANAETPTLFVGGRCHLKDPELDDNGRVLEPSCFDTNPATWHMAIVNQVGRDKRSFVMDATFDYEVWNQPVVSYEYLYFNPETLKVTDKIEEAKLNINSYQNDKFKKYRSEEAQSVVGIAMEVTYVVETQPMQRAVDHEKYDLLNKVLYYYDLELDKEGNIIGGEWYQNFHPDFLWTPPTEARALSMADLYLLSDAYWKGEGALPDQWKELGNAMAKLGSPLAMIVESLIELSNRPEGESNE